MMNNANDGAEASNSKSFLYPLERIRKISVARVHWMWFFDQPHYQHICHCLRLSADLVEYLLRTFLSWQMSFLSDWWIYFLPKKHICYPINANISSCCLPSCAVSDTHRRILAFLALWGASAVCSLVIWIAMSLRIVSGLIWGRKRGNWCR